MCKQILSVVSILALLLYPLSLSSQNTFSLSLDANSAAGDQAARSIEVSPDQVVSIQVFGSSIQNANGFGLRFEYDASQVTYQGFFDADSVLPGTPRVLPSYGTNPTSVTINIESLGGQATVSSGLVGAIRFRTTTGFSGTAVQLVRADLSRSGQSETITLTARVDLQVAPEPSPDFDGDGEVGISDFLQFVDHYGTSLGEAGYDAKYDLNGNDTIGIPDFLIFVDHYGSRVPPSGDGGSPDLIVASPSVSDTILARGQLFTLSATVRNTGTGSSASTTLRYYQSPDATISTSDREIGTDRVSGLSASGTSAESIRLNALPGENTYYYGACVESVIGESNTDNNCSDGVRVTPVVTVLYTCSGTLDSSTGTAPAKIEGTAQAHKTVSSLIITGYANDQEVGIDELGALSAGQSQNFSISGTISTSISVSYCYVKWSAKYSR